MKDLGRIWEGSGEGSGEDLGSGLRRNLLIPRLRRKFLGSRVAPQPLRFPDCAATFYASGGGGEPRWEDVSRGGSEETLGRLWGRLWVILGEDT